MFIGQVALSSLMSSVRSGICDYTAPNGAQLKLISHRSINISLLRSEIN